MNFIVAEMTYLRYFIPLIIEGNKNNVSSTVYIKPCGKYSCPIRNSVVLQNLSIKYNFNIKHISELSLSSEAVFTIEGVGFEHTNLQQKKYVIPYMLDFTNRFNLYAEQADHIVFLSQFVANYYGVETDKNLYLGSPKYDLQYDKQHILKKYGLQDFEKIALVAFPRTRDLNKVNLDELYSYLRKDGYKIVVKTRGKDPVPDMFKGDKYFVDFSWFPHDTLELLYASDILINFGSSTIKEAAFMNTPVIDFDIKPKKVVTTFQFLCNEPTCITLPSNVQYEQFSDAINKLLSLNIKYEYDIIRGKYFVDGNCSEKILKTL